MSIFKNIESLYQVYQKFAYQKARIYLQMVGRFFYPKNLPRKMHVIGTCRLM